MGKQHKRAFFVLVIIWLVLQFIGLPHFEEIIVDLAVNTFILFVMLAPFTLREIIKYDDAKKTFAAAAAVICAGQLLCIVVQIPVGFIFRDKGFQFFAETVVLMIFWLLEAEIFCRIQFKGTVKKTILHWKSLLIFITMCIGLTLIFHLDNLIGSAVMERMLENGNIGMKWEVFLNTVFDKIVGICKFAAYYHVLSIVVTGIKRINDDIS